MRLATIFVLTVTASFLLISPPARAGGEHNVAFDVIPGECPNFFTPIILRGEGVLRTAIPGDDNTDPDSIDRQSLLIVVPEGGGGANGGFAEIPPLETFIADLSTAFFPELDCECIDDGGDDVDDLIIDFPFDKISKVLENYPDGAEVQLHISGKFNNGDHLDGADCVRVTFPVPVDGTSWGSVKAEYR